MNKLDEIEKFFKDYDFEGRQIKISQCERVLNVKNFVESHIKMLRANTGNKRYLPYFDRINKLYLLLKSEL